MVPSPRTELLDFLFEPDTVGFVDRDGVLYLFEPDTVGFVDLDRVLYLFELDTSFGFVGLDRVLYLFELDTSFGFVDRDRVLYLLEPDISFGFVDRDRVLYLLEPDISGGFVDVPYQTFAPKPETRISRWECFAHGGTEYFRPITVENSFPCAHTVTIINIHHGHLTSGTRVSTSNRRIILHTVFSILIVL